MTTVPSDWHDFLGRMIQALHARGGAVLLADGRELRQVAAEGMSPAEMPAADAARQRLVNEVMQSSQARSMEIDDAESNGGAAALDVAALLVNDRAVGVLEIVQRPRRPQQLLQGQLEFLAQSCRWQAADAPARSAPLAARGQTPVVVEAPEAPVSDPSAGAPQNLVDWPALLECLQQIQRHRRVKDAAESIVNEARLLFDADRVSLGVPRGRAIQIIAASGQDRVQPRSNMVQAMARLARLIAATRQPFRFEGGLEDVPPSLEQPLARYVQLSGARMVLIVPLLTPLRAEAQPPERAAPARPAKRDLQGVLIIDQMRHSRPEPKLVAHIDHVREPIAAALTHARAYDSILLLPVWLALGQAWSKLRGRRLAWTAALAALLAAGAASLFVVSWPYRVEAQGQLMPVVQRDIFAPWDGQVVELLVRGGERVSSGQPLVRLRNDDLASEQARIRGELAEKRKLVIALFAEIDEAERNAQRDEEARLRGKVAETQIEVEALGERLRILTDRIDRLTVRAPLAGIVTTFQAEQLLTNRPVQRGDVLLQVMDDNGDWQLELDLAEHRLGHLLAAQRQRPDELPIHFRLLTQPEAAHQAKLTSIGTRSVVSEQRGSVVELRASLDRDASVPRSIGAQVRARIDCGRKPLGYCLFGDVIEFVQKYLWW